MGVIINSGPAKVVDSGSTTTFMGHPLTLRVALDERRYYEIEFRFTDVEEPPGPTAETEISGSGIVIELRNFHDVAGRGSGQPVLLGEQGELLYFLHFRVWHSGRTADPMVHYTVFSATKEAIGWVEAAGATGAR